MAALFSIIIPSFLGSYPNAAKNREAKMLRALTSVSQQTFTDYEIRFIADGCERSVAIATEYAQREPRMHVQTIPKQPRWSGMPRNIGLRNSGGKYAVYLDIDDMWGDSHLSIINAAISANNEPKWLFFDDWLGSPDYTFRRRYCSPDERHRNGTSNICHRVDIGVEWGGGYLHDFEFIEKLKKICPPVIIEAAEYYVCHVPKRLDI